MRELYARMAELERDGRPFAVATVVRTVGSTPQVVGAKMLIDDLGRTYGTLGGGCVEGDAFAEAKRIIAEGGSSLREYELTEELAWDTGLVCGGTMWIHIEPAAGALTVGDRDLLADVLAASSTGTPIALATLLRKEGRELIPAGRLYVEQSGGSGGTLGDAALDARAHTIAAEALQAGTARTAPLGEDRELLVEPIVAKPHLVVVGAGHVGLALAKLAQGLDYDVTVIDDRPAFASQERFPDGVEVVRADMVDALGTLPIGWNAFIVVATRGHKLDAQCLRAAIQTKARYVGLLGSKRKTILIERMLREEGLPEDRIRSVHAPVGLDLGGRTPPEIALSVLAELSMERYGGSGRPLRLGDELYERAVGRTAT
ncbi:MAG TPA: XdhC/CoxI family protein [Candidatus Limnocylindria bacterium]|nr:XdhC/CoxI family protein [Candidatus Limnocylindria bacterium]